MKWDLGNIRQLVENKKCIQMVKLKSKEHFYGNCKYKVPKGIQR